MIERATPDGMSALATEPVRRRDFINVAAVSFAGVGVAVAVVPLINQMNPSADVLAMASIEIDLTPILPGQAIKALWRKQPLFARNLTQQEITASYAVPMKDLRDPQTLAERTKEGKSNWLITLGVGTVRNFVREAIGWNGRDHRYGNRQGRFGPASGWS